jgi:Secretion system C-terminal sorting domain
MKQLYFFSLLLISLNSFGLIKTWDGQAGDGLWATATNWADNVVPVAGDDVVLNNLLLPGTYTVTLPNTAVTIQSITITPNIGDNITLILPSTNTLQPGLIFSGPANSNVLVLNDGGIFRNSTGAPNSSPEYISISTADTIRINNGGRFVHNVIRSHAFLVSQLSRSPGTEKGIFEFDVPFAAASAVSLLNQVYGTLKLSSVANGAPKAYNGGTASDATIRGNLEIDINTTFSPTVTGNILLGGDLIIAGTFNWAPSLGTTNRSLIFNGTVNGTQAISGSGTYTVSANFRNIVVKSNSTVSLQRNITGFSAGDSIIVEPNATLLLPGENHFSGTGSVFFNDTLSTLEIGSANGISASGATGNVQTDTRNFSKKAYYYYNGTSAQATGSGLPDSVYRLHIQNPADVTLSSQLCVTQQLALDSGLLFTTTVNRIKLALSGITTSRGINDYGSANQGNATSFISGPMIIETNITDTITFPIGKKSGLNLLYAPVKLKPFNTALKEYRTEYFPMTHFDAGNVEASLDHVSSVEYWDISCNVFSTPDNAAKISLSWRPQSAVGTGNPADSLNAMQDLTVAHYFNAGAGIKWNIDGGGVATFTIRPNSNLSYGFITTDIATGSFSPFTLGTRSPFNILPLKLLNFSGEVEETAIKLRWITQEEKDIDRYELQKSTDGRNFSTISIISSLNSLSTFTYNNTDARPAVGWNYYRLKVFDNQQYKYYTATVKVWYGTAGRVMVYPNPASDQLKIILPSRSNSTISIVNSAGQVVRLVSTTDGLLTINIASLDKGMYLVYIQTNRQAIVQRFIKQ